MERRLTDLVDQKIGNAMKTTCDKVEKIYSAVVAAETTTRINQAQTTQHAARSNSDHNINQSFRIQGVPTNDEVNEILDIIGVKPKIIELKRLGKFDRNRMKPKKLLVTVPSEHEARLVLAKSREKREQLVEKEVYLLPALTKESAIKENEILKKRRQLLDEGVPRKKLKIRNLELFNDGVKVTIDTELRNPSID